MSVLLFWDTYLLDVDVPCLFSTTHWKMYVHSFCHFDSKGISSALNLSGPQSPVQLIKQRRGYQLPILLWNRKPFILFWPQFECCFSTWQMILNAFVKVQNIQLYWYWHFKSNLKNTSIFKPTFVNYYGSS